MVWQCNHKFDGGEKCTTPHLDEETIRQLFIKALNTINREKSRILAGFEEIRDTAFETGEMEAEARQLNEEMSVAAELIQKCIGENARVAQNQGEYRKEYVPDYLEQKKIKNHGEIENIVAEGTHIPIVTKEEYARVKKKMDAKTQSVDNRGKRGKHASGDVWTKKLKCSCSGGSFNRRVWHRVASGEPQYAYQCYRQITTGTIATRTKKGLSLEGICEAPMVPRWKLEVMAKVVFQNFWKDRTAVRLIAEEMLERHIQDDRYINFEKEIKELKTKIAKTDKKYENLVDLRVNGEIDKAMFDLKKKELLEEKERLERQLEGYQVDEDMSDEDYNRRLEVLKCGLENNFDFSVYDIPEEIIDDFVDEIIVYKDCFLWKLSMFGDETRMKLCVNKDKSVEIEKTPNVDTRGTGGYITKIGENHFGLLP